MRGLNADLVAVPHVDDDLAAHRVQVKPGRTRRGDRGVGIRNHERGGKRTGEQGPEQLRCPRVGDARRMDVDCRTSDIFRLMLSARYALRNSLFGSCSSATRASAIAWSTIFRLVSIVAMVLGLSFVRPASSSVSRSPLPG